MVYQSRTSTAARTFALAKQRVRKGQKRAKRIGLFYLLAIIALTVLACLPLMTIVDYVDESYAHGTGVVGMLAVFTSGEESGMLAMGVSVMYFVMLLVVAVSLIQAFGKLGWLCKKKASRTYGLNRPMYAMDDMARLFARVFTAVVVGHLAIASFAIEETFEMLAYVTLGVGFLFHFLCGIATFKVGLFDIADGFLGQTREYRKMGSFIRNLFQVVICGAMAWALVKSSTLFNAVYTLYANFDLSDIMGMLVPVLQIVGFFAWVAMVKYAVSDVEYDIDGREAEGRKRFFLRSLIALACFAGAMVLGTELPQEATWLVYMTAAAVVLEIILCRLPRKNVAKIKDDVDAQAFINAVYGGKPQAAAVPQKVMTQQVMPQQVMPPFAVNSYQYKY